MLNRCSVALFALLAIQISRSTCLNKVAGPVGVITLYTFGTCPDPGAYNYKVSMKTSDDESRRISMTGTIPVEVTSDFEYTMIADKWNNGQWEKDAFKVNGAIYEDANKMFPDLWQHIREKIDPPIEDPDLIPPNTYTLVDFEDVASSLGMDQIVYGRFKVRLEIFDADKLVFCIQSELDSLEE